MSDNKPAEENTSFTTPEGAGRLDRPAEGITTEEGPRAGQLAQSIQAAPTDVTLSPDVGTEATVIVAEYTIEDAARVALTALQAEGIQATVSGAMADPANYSIFEALNCEPIQVAVLREQAEEARRILQHLDEPPEPGWEKKAEQAVDGWLCHECDTVVDQAALVCPACGTPRDQQPPESDEEEEE
jgi:rubrerythrin